MKARLESLLFRAAAASARTTRESRVLAGDREQILKVALFLVLLFALGAIYVPSFLRAVGVGASFSPDVAFSKDAQFVYYGGTAVPCGFDATKGPAGCFAHPGDRALFASPFRRSDAEHPVRMKANQAREFWIGIEVPVEQLHKALLLGANHLVLGYFEASYRVWADGKYLAGTQGWHESELITIALPAARLAEERPLRVAIQVYHDVGSTLPDQMNVFAGAEGFYSMPRLQTYYARLLFWFKARPFSLFLTYLVLSLAFFAFWAPARIKQEYFYLGLHTLVCAFAQARMMDVFFASVSANVGSALRVALEWYQPAFGMFLGLSFARVRETVFRIGIPVTLLLPAVANLIVLDNHTRSAFCGIIRTWIGPTCYAAGGLACVVQGAYLLGFDRSDAGRRRGRRLVLFAAGMFALGAFYWLLLPRLWNTTGRAWLGIEHLALILYLGAIALREHRAQAKEVSRTPVSDYHRREILPDKITGALLVAVFSGEKSLADEGGTNLWRSHFYTAVLRFGGTIVYHKGEDLIAFFDQANCGAPLASGLRAAAEVERAGRAMAFEAARGDEPVAFRASLVEGSIRPVWEELAGSREPYWEEAGDTTPFVEAARLLEMDDRSVGGTVVVTTERTAAGLTARHPELASLFIQRGLERHDKHAQRYTLAICRPGAAEPDSSLDKAA